MDPLARHLLAHAYHNAWANHRLLGACEQLAQAEFEAPRIGFFASIRATLNHLLMVDWYDADAIERGLRGDAPNPAWAAFFEPEALHADAAGLHAAQRDCDARLIALCHALDPVRLEQRIGVPRRERVEPEPLHRLLAPLYQHQTHHRGQAHAMLSGSSVAPPQLDEFFCAGAGAGDAARRPPDFEALGWAEAAIWGAPE